MIKLYDLSFEASGWLDGLDAETVQAILFIADAVMIEYEMRFPEERLGCSGAVELVLASLKFYRKGNDERFNGGDDHG